MQERAFINQPDEIGNTALHRAAKAGEVERVNKLIQLGADANLQNNRKETPLDLALQADHPKVMALLLPVTAKKDVVMIKRSDFKEHNYPWDVGLMFKALEKSESIAIEILTLLKTHGADFNKKDNYGNTLLTEAVDKYDECNINLVRFLLDNGVDVNVANDQMKWTALHIAATRGNIEATRLLLERRADTEVRDKNGFTPSELASKEIEIHSIRSSHWESDKARDNYIKPYKVVRNLIDEVSSEVLRAAKVKELLAKGRLLSELGKWAQPRVKEGSVSDQHQDKNFNPITNSQNHV